MSKKGFFASPHLVLYAERLLAFLLLFHKNRFASVEDVLVEQHWMPKICTSKSNQHTNWIGCFSVLHYYIYVLTNWLKIRNCNLSPRTIEVLVFFRPWNKIYWILSWNVWLIPFFLLTLFTDIIHYCLWLSVDYERVEMIISIMVVQEGEGFIKPAYLPLASRECDAPMMIFRIYDSYIFQRIACTRIYEIANTIENSNNH